MNQLGRNHPIYDLVCRKKGRAKFYVDVKGVAKKSTNWPVQERKPKPKDEIRYARAKERIARNPLLYILVCLDTNALTTVTREEQERIYTDYRNRPNSSKTNFLVISRKDLRDYSHEPNDLRKLLAVAEQERRQNGS